MKEIFVVLLGGMFFMILPIMAIVNDGVEMHTVFFILLWQTILILFGMAFTFVILTVKGHMP